MQEIQKPALNRNRSFAVYIFDLSSMKICWPVRKTDSWELLIRVFRYTRRTSGKYWQLKTMDSGGAEEEQGLTSLQHYIEVFNNTDTQLRCPVDSPWHLAEQLYSKKKKLRMNSHRSCPKRHPFGTVKHTSFSTHESEAGRVTRFKSAGAKQ